MTTLKYPLEIGPSGDLVTVEDYETKVSQAILSTLHSLKGERVWYPRLGRDRLVFQSTTDIPAILAAIRATIEYGIAEYPGVSFNILGAFIDDGSLMVQVNYQVNRGPSRTFKTSFVP